LIRDDPEVFEAFRHHTLTGELVTPLAQPQATLRHLLLQMLPPSQISELDEGEDPCTEVYYIEASGSPTVNGSTMSSEIDVMKKPKPCPPTGGVGPPGDYDEFERALRDLVRNSGLDTDVAPNLYSHDGYFFDPGFDCDDYATAMAHYLERHLPTHAGSFSVWSLWLTWLGGGHAVTVVLLGDKFYVIDPQSGAVRGPFHSREEAVHAGWDILKDPTIGYDIDPFYQRSTWRKPDSRPFGEPAPWHDDPDEVDHFQRETQRDPSDYMPLPIVP